MKSVVPAMLKIKRLLYIAYAFAFPIAGHWTDASLIEYHMSIKNIYYK